MKKQPVFSPLMGKAGAPPPNLVNHLACPSIPCSPALLCSVPHGDQSAATELRLSEHIYQRVFVPESGMWELGCVIASPISFVSSAHTVLPTRDSFDLPWGASESCSEGTFSAHPPSQAYLHHLKMRVSGSVFPSPSGSALLNSALGAGTFRMPSPSEVYVWDWDLPPFYMVSWHQP